MPPGVDVLVNTGAAGPAAARNAGARAASGDMILFCDDDCEPNSGWAEILSAACPEGGTAAGETTNANPADRYARASQFLTSELQRRSAGEDGRLGFAPTSNLAIDRAALAGLPFDETFPLAAGEDREWCARAIARGAAPVYEPRAVVLHRQMLGGMRGFARQQLRYGRGAATLRSRGVELARPTARLALLREAYADGATSGMLAVLAQAAVAAGFLGGLLRPGEETRPGAPRGLSP